MGVERAKAGLAKDVGGEAVLSILVVESLLPINRCQLEHTLAIPTRQQAEQVAHVCERFDAVELAAREQRDESRVDIAAFVASDEQPIFSSHGFSAQLELRGVVVQRQAGITKKATE